MSDMLHIASVVVQHRPEAAAGLDAALAGLSGLELAVREGSQSIVICESADERTLIDRIESLRSIAGVIGVSLVHHHAESRQSLYEEM